MAKNHRGGLDERQHFTAAAARTSGTLVWEGQHAVVPITDAASGARYAGATGGEWEIPLASGAAKGDDVFITTADNTITRAARGTAAAGGTVRIGRVVGIPTDPVAGAVTDTLPPAGQMIIRLDNS